MNGLISVIIPVYNREKVVAECINSVLAQSYRDFEIIIIDDGSTDQTVEICEKLSSSDNRIRLIKAEHGGVSNARNIGLNESNGEFVFFLDSDDIIHPHLLSALIKGMEEHNAEISGTGVININEKNWHKANELITQDNSEGTTEYKTHEEALEGFFTTSTPINLIGGVMMRKSLIGDTLFNTELFIGEDYYFIYENLIKGASAVFLNEKWYYCRIHSSNSSFKYDFDAFWTRFHRRELVWKREQEFGRTDNVKRQKADAMTCYMRCILRNNPKSEEAKKIKKVIKQYKKELLEGTNFKNKMLVLARIYMPYTTEKILKTIRGKD